LQVAPLAKATALGQACRAIVISLSFFSPTLDDYCPSRIAQLSRLLKEREEMKCTSVLVQ